MLFDFDYIISQLVALLLDADEGEALFGAGLFVADAAGALLVHVGAHLKWVTSIDRTLLRKLLTAAFVQHDALEILFTRLLSDRNLLLYDWTPSIFLKRQLLLDLGVAISFNACASEILIHFVADFGLGLWQNLGLDSFSAS